MGHRVVTWQEKNERRRNYRDDSEQGKKARAMRRAYSGTFGDPNFCHPLNYNLMVVGTSANGDVRLTKDGEWA